MFFQQKKKKSITCFSLSSCMYCTISSLSNRSIGLKRISVKLILNIAKQLLQTVNLWVVPTLNPKYFCIMGCLRVVNQEPSMTTCWIDTSQYKRSISNITWILNCVCIEVISMVIKYYIIYRVTLIFFWRWRFSFVQGHTDGHMALLHVNTHSLIVGDHCVG